MDVPRFVRRATLPQTDPEAVQPALLNAIYLAACQLVQGELAQYQNVLLTRARAYLDEALARVDRLPHFLAASLVLASWYGRNGRLVEAQYVISFFLLSRVSNAHLLFQTSTLPFVPAPRDGRDNVSLTRLCL